MRYTIIIFIISFFAVSCGKDKFTSEPQIRFKSIKPDRAKSSMQSIDPGHPIITLGITDAEGDIGFKGGAEVSYLYIKNTKLSRLDSLPLPDIQSLEGKDFQGDIIIDVFDVLRPNPGTTRPRVDTIFYEIYVVDFAKHKSNVITTADPLYYEIQ